MKKRKPPWTALLQTIELLIASLRGNADEVALRQSEDQPLGRAPTEDELFY